LTDDEGGGDGEEEEKPEADAKRGDD